MHNNTYLIGGVHEIDQNVAQVKYQSDKVYDYHSSVVSEAPIRQPKSTADQARDTIIIFVYTSSRISLTSEFPTRTVNEGSRRCSC